MHQYKFRLWDMYVFRNEVITRLIRAQRGNSITVRGAIWLWPLQFQHTSLHLGNPIQLFFHIIRVLRAPQNCHS